MVLCPVAVTCAFLGVEFLNDSSYFSRNSKALAIDGALLMELFNGFSIQSLT